MAVLADVVLNPTFPQSEFARERQLQLDALAQQSTNADALVARIRPMLLFGASTSCTAGPSRACRRASARSRATISSPAHSTRWKPGSSAAVFVGDISLEEARQLAQQHFGALERRRGRGHRHSSPAACRGRQALSRRSQGRGADRDRPVVASGVANGRRLLRLPPGGRGVGRRRLRHQAQPEPARGQGLLVRRLLQRDLLLARRASGPPAAACRPTAPRSR